MQHLRVLAIVALCGLSASVAAQDLTWRKDIQPLIKDNCGACHGASAPNYEEWNLDSQDFEAEKIDHGLDNYADFMRHVVWPATGAIARRLDDGKNAEGKPGNMHAFLGATDQDRAAPGDVEELAGRGRMEPQSLGSAGNLPAITKEQLDKIKAKY